MFEHLAPTPGDAILALTGLFRDDPRAGKIDLGVGVYKDAHGRTPVMAAVRAAEHRLLETQDSKAYLGLLGDEAFNAQMRTLVFGTDGPLDRARALQTPGGCGALRILAELARRARPDATVWLSEPTWPNHAPIMSGSGLSLRSYPYLDPTTMGVRVTAMLEALEAAGPGDLVLLHGCCHNPTGAELSLADWEALAEVAARRGFVPFVDLAYQGFGGGVEADVAGLRLLAGAVDEMLVATSCSKNFGLYRDRVGAALLLGRSPERVDNMLSQLTEVARASYSMPPDHGAAIVSMVLQDAALRRSWRDELDGMRRRMGELRAAAAAALRAQTKGDGFDFLARHRGMFSLAGTTVEQVRRLREEYAVYMVGAGRMNIAGLKEDQVDRFAAALATVTHT